jgi:hypothetical protein
MLISLVEQAFVYWLRKFGTPLATLQRCVRVGRTRDGDDFSDAARDGLEPPSR